MQRWLLIICLLFSQIVFAQRGILYVKKRGYKNVRTFAEGSALSFKTRDKKTVQGILSLVKGDSLYINGFWYYSGDISRVILRNNSVVGPLLLTTGGVLGAAGAMTIANWATFRESVGWAAGVGYSNFAIRVLPKYLKRKKYKIGRKYTLQTLDLRF